MLHHLLNRILTRHIFEDMRLSRTSKLVYLGMRTVRKTNIAGYAQQLDMPYKTVWEAIKQLKEFGWAYSYSDPKTRRSIVVPWMPIDLEEAVSKEVQRLMDTARNKGEFIAKAVMSTYVDDTNFLDNHRPKWAISPQSRHPLEYDRIYEDLRVAIEFQGRQHFETVVFRDGKSNLVEQMARDRAKMVACDRKGYAFVEIVDAELSCETIFAKLDGLLPLVQPLKDRPLYQTLSELCLGHAAWARDQYTER